MAISLGTKGGVKADINVTPLVDVMLVLLIIFMVVTPLLQKGVDVRLPTAGNTTDKPDNESQVVLAIKADRTLYLNQVPVRTDELTTKLQDIMESKKQHTVLIKADEAVEYRAVMAAMDTLRKAGIEEVALITERKVAPGGAGGQD